MPLLDRLQNFLTPDGNVDTRKENTRGGYVPPPTQSERQQALGGGILSGLYNGNADATYGQSYGGPSLDDMIRRIVASGGLQTAHAMAQPHQGQPPYGLPFPGQLDGGLPFAGRITGALPFAGRLPMPGGR